MEPFHFRQGTDEHHIFNSVMHHNEYRLPERLDPDAIVVDIGMHIGSFCYAALQRGAKRVYGYEAERSNYECAVKNLERYGDRVRLNNKAVWRSDTRVERLYFTASTDERNTGGGNVIFSDQGQSVEVVRFDDVIREATSGGRERVRILKLDCETSEFPILLTTRKLHLVDSIVGEFHEVGGEFDPHTIPAAARVRGYDRFTIVELTKKLESEGFAVESIRSPGSNLGLFFARREAVAPAGTLLAAFRRIGAGLLGRRRSA